MLDACWEKQTGSVQDSVIACDTHHVSQRLCVLPNIDVRDDDTCTRSQRVNTAPRSQRASRD